MSFFQLPISLGVHFWWQNIITDAPIGFKVGSLALFQVFCLPVLSTCKSCESFLQRKPWKIYLESARFYFILRARKENLSLFRRLGCDPFQLVTLHSGSYIHEYFIDKYQSYSLRSRIQKFPLKPFHEVTTLFNWLHYEENFCLN